MISASLLAACAQNLRWILCLTAPCPPAAVEEPEEEPEEESPIEDAPQPRGRGRRTNVFVEAVELDDDWKPPSYEKTEEEGKRLEGYIAKTALLAYLDEKARVTVIAAFQKKNCAKDENVISQVRAAT